MITPTSHRVKSSFIEAGLYHRYAAAMKAACIRGG